jgi:hypothetical protein
MYDAGEPSVKRGNKPPAPSSAKPPTLPNKTLRQIEAGL